MTILNGLAQGERAFVAVDTLADSPAGVRRVGKIYPLAHLGAVISGRGAFVDIAGCAAMLNLRASSFDGALELAPGVMAEIMEASRKAHLASGLDPDHPTYGVNAMQLTLFGWSEARGRMEGALFMRRLGEAVERTEVVDAATAAPWDPAWGALPALRGLPDLCSLARTQVALCARDFPDRPIGGDLIVAELLKGAVRIWRASSL